MQVFQKNDSLLGGIDEAIAILKTCSGHAENGEWVPGWDRLVVRALHEGFGVLIAVDACGGMSERTETAALNQIRDTGGIITSVVSLATALSLDFTTPTGQQMFQIVQTLRLT